MPAAIHVIVLALFVVATCIWVGGYVAIAVVARVATKTLDPAGRITFFKTLGRVYLRVGLPALVVALGTGAGLLSTRSWNGVATAAVVVSAALVATLAFGVVQARRMTRLRTAALAASQDGQLGDGVQRSARSAATLRTAIGVLSLTLVVLGSVLAS